MGLERFRTISAKKKLIADLEASTLPGTRRQCETRTTPSTVVEELQSLSEEGVLRCKSDITRKHNFL